MQCLIIYKKHYDVLFDFVCIYIIEKVGIFGRDDLTHYKRNIIWSKFWFLPAKLFLPTHLFFCFKTTRVKSHFECEIWVISSFLLLFFLPLHREFGFVVIELECVVENDTNWKVVDNGIRNLSNWSPKINVELVYWFGNFHLSNFHWGV